MWPFKKTNNTMKSFFDSEYKMAEIIRNMQKEAKVMSKEKIEEIYNKTCADIESYRDFDQRTG